MKVISVTIVENYELKKCFVKSRLKVFTNLIPNIGCCRLESDKLPPGVGLPEKCDEEGEGGPKV